MALALTRNGALGVISKVIKGTFMNLGSMAFAELCGPSAPEGWIFSDELLTVYERSQVLSDISCAEPLRTECLSRGRQFHLQ